jgi:hypothetical protein
MAKRGAFRFVGIGSHLSQCQSESVKTFSIVSHYLYLLQDIYADTRRGIVAQRWQSRLLT